MPEVTINNNTNIQSGHKPVYGSAGSAVSNTAKAIASQWYLVRQESIPVITQQPRLHKFCNLAVTWKEETKMVSSAKEMALHPAYQEIIGMGEKAVPYILADLKIETSHWFWALRAITGVDPVPPSDKGNTEKMRENWIIWGEQNGYI